MMRRTGVIAAVILTSITAAGVLWPYIRQVINIPSEKGLIVLITIIVLIYWVGSYIYEHTGGMFQHEVRGEAKYNSYMIDHFNAWEEMTFTHFHLTNMKANYAILKELGLHNQAYEVGQEIERVENWFKIGYILDEDFPEHLKHFLPKGKQRRF